jgi:hypothetical protein
MIITNLIFSFVNMFGAKAKQVNAPASNPPAEMVNHIFQTIIFSPTPAKKSMYGSIPEPSTGIRLTICPIVWPMGRSPFVHLIIICIAPTLHILQTNWSRITQIPSSYAVIAPVGPTPIMFGTSKMLSMFPTTTEIR